MNMEFGIHIKNVQHVGSMIFKIDLSKNRLMGIIGRNGVGKTTLMKSLQNFRSADTFKKTSPDFIFRPESAIEYTFGDSKILFSFDSKISSLNTKQIIPNQARMQIDVELASPFGQRFNFYQSISQADSEIRRAIALQDYEAPKELIQFLKDIYDTDKFDRLVEIKLRKDSHYCVLVDGGRYIREDYLSAGEYFLINLYRKIKSRCKLIAIDEIDISLDAAAQVNLVKMLRDFCTKYEVNIVFSTHSLAMMQSLHDEELFQSKRPVKSSRT